MFETSAKPPINRSGVSAVRRKPWKIKECGFLPKAATLLLQRSRELKFDRQKPLKYKGIMKSGYTAKMRYIL